MFNCKNLNQNRIRTFGFSLFLFVILTIPGCSLKIPSEEPTWVVSFDFPIANENITMEEILDDSLLTTISSGENGEPVLYAFQDTITIERQTFDDTIGFDPIKEFFSSELDTIVLENIEPSKTEAYRLDEIYPSISGLSGNNIIPSFTLSPISRNFTFDNFKSADFSSGLMSLTIQNDMIIPLGYPLNIDLEDMNGNTLVYSAATWDEEIASNSSSSKTLNLSGISLTGGIKIVVTGSSPGSNGSAVFVDDESRSSSFTIEISAEGPEVVSAIAKVPEQKIDNMGDIQIDSEDKVERAKIDKGIITIGIKNGLDLTAYLNLTIPSIQDDNGAIFSQLIELPRKEEIISIYNLNKRWLILDASMDIQEMTYYYEVVTENSKNDMDPFRSVKSDDLVDVEINLYGSGVGEQVTFSEIKGILKAIEEPIKTIRQEISSLPDEINGMQFIEAEMKLLIDSNIEFPVKLDMDIVAFNNDTSATRRIRGWNITHPDSQVITILDASELINIKPDSIVAFGKAIIGGTNDIVTYRGNESFSGLFSISVPFVFELLEDAKIDLDIEKVDQNFPEDIESITLFIEYENMFDFNANISVLSSTDPSHFEEDSPTVPNVLSSITIQGNSTSADSFYLDKTQIKLFDDITFVKAKVFVSSEGQVKFLSTDSLKVSSYGSINYLIDPDINEN